MEEPDALGEIYFQFLKSSVFVSGILLSNLWIQVSSEMCGRGTKVMPAGQDPKSSRSGVSPILFLHICVNCVSFFNFKGLEFGNETQRFS